MPKFPLPLAHIVAALALALGVFGLVTGLTVLERVLGAVLVAVGLAILALYFRSK